MDFIEDVSFNGYLELFASMVSNEVPDVLGGVTLHLIKVENLLEVVED